MPVAGCSDDDSDSAAAPQRTSTQQSTEARESTEAAGPAIVRVGDVEISRVRYERLLAKTAAGYAKARTLPGRRYYVPPKYSLCIRNRREWRSVPADWPASKVRIQCRHNHQRLRTSLLSSLIEDEWLDQEADKQGIEPPTDPTARFSELPAELAQAAVDMADAPVSDLDVAKYYRRHRGFLRRPEQRNWRAVLFPEEAKAQRAKDAIERGLGWAAAARRYGNPDVGAVPQDSVVSPDSVEIGLRKPIFQADKGELVGPVASQSGFYVFTVEKIAPAEQLSLAESREAIVPVLETNRREQAQIDYWRAMRLAARERTVCLTELEVPDCSNGPRARFDADGVAFGRTNPRPVLPPPGSEPDQGDTEPEALP